MRNRGCFQIEDFVLFLFLGNIIITSVSVAWGDVFLVQYFWRSSSGLVSNMIKMIITQKTLCQNSEVEVVGSSVVVVCKIEDQTQ